jgi:RNA-directed DNA polymerase
VLPAIPCRWREPSPDSAPPRSPWSRSSACRAPRWPAKCPATSACAATHSASTYPKAPPLRRRSPTGARSTSIALASAAHAAGASYSRYADDLAFSGSADFPRRARAFTTLAAGIALDEGFDVNFHKTRVMPQATRQRLCGVVVNAHPNIARPDYDRLKAILTNCQRHGAAGQNRDGRSDFRAHLRGRVAWVEAVAPARGAELLALFETIDWG